MRIAVLSPFVDRRHGTERSLVGSFCMLLKQPELGRSLGEDAARKATQFSWDRQVEPIHRRLAGSEPKR